MQTRFIRTLVGAIALLSATSAVQAEQAADFWPEGTYFEIRAGANFLNDADNSSGGSGSFLGETGFDTGFTTSVAFGYELANKNLFGSGFWNDIRIEVEIGYAESDIENSASNADISTNNYMLNAYYDFDTGTKWRPFIGAGIGAALIEVDGVSLRDDEDTVLAYQARAGIAYQFTSSIIGTLGYRFLGTEDPELRSATGTRFETEIQSHAVEVGLRFRF